MRLIYTCSVCGDPIDTVIVDVVDEVKFGFDCLTPEERRDIINIDSVTGDMHVRSLCDSCIEALGLQDKELTGIYKPMYLH